MSSFEKTTYFGLPVPSHEEFLDLEQNRQTNSEYSSFDQGQLTKAVLDNSPLIQDVISFDINYWITNEADHNLSLDEINEFCSGVQKGYIFFIDFYTGISFMRSDAMSIESFLEDERANSLLPLVNGTSFKRIVDVRSGKAITDEYYTDKFLDDSSNLAFLTSGDYTSEALRFETLYDNEVNYLTKILENKYEYIDSDEAMSLIQGFNHGVAQAIEMYVQISEEIIIKNIQDYRNN